MECQRNDRNAQRKVYEIMAGRLYAVCRRYLKNEEDIEEVLADTFCKIFTKVGHDTFEVWVRKIIIRKENLNEGKDTVDMTSYPQGIYLIRIRSGEAWETFKVIKN